MADRRYVKDLPAKLRFLATNPRMREKHGLTMAALSVVCGKQDGWLKSATAADRNTQSIDREVEAKLADRCGFDPEWREWREGTEEAFQKRLLSASSTEATLGALDSREREDAASTPQPQESAGAGPPPVKRPSPMMVPKPPKDLVARPAEFDALKAQLLSSGTKGMVAITAALRGAGGYGKTTLACALAHDEDIRRAHPDGVLWVELGEQGGPRVVPIIADLVHLLGGGSRAPFRREKERAPNWRARSAIGASSLSSMTSGSAPTSSRSFMAGLPPRG
jgi:hypothetical protein